MIDFQIQKDIPATTVVLRFVVVIAASNQLLLPRPPMRLSLLRRTPVSIRCVIQFGSWATKVKDLDDGMTCTTSNEPFGSDGEKGIYGRKCVDRVAKDSRCRIVRPQVMEARELG